jgi:hypothetical protein
MEQHLISKGTRLDDNSRVIDSICLENGDITRPEQLDVDVEAARVGGLQSLSSVFVRPRVFGDSSEKFEDDQVKEKLNSIRRLLFAVLHLFLIVDYKYSCSYHCLHI